jgi:hypothetical protein
MRQHLLPLALAALIVTPAAAQVEVSSLQAPDYFSLGSRDTGLPADLWKGTSPELARAQIPRIGGKPLSPAAADLAGRLLATGANGPEGAGREPEVAAARINALLALGRPRDAWAAADRAVNLPSSAALSQAVAESALIAGEDDRACRVADELAVNRGDIYWLRLRAYCQARAGQSDAAQLTLTLASEKQRDPVVSRLIGAVIAGAGDPGAASVRDGLEYSLSRRLALDVVGAKGAPPAIAAAIGAQPPAAPPVSALAQRLAASEGRDAEFAALLAQATDAADAKAKARYQGAVLVALALGATPTADQRGVIAGFDVQPVAIPAGRLAALDLAASAGARGETALLVLAAAADAGGKPMRASDYAAVVSALRRAGLQEQAVAFAGEAFAALQAE